MNNDNNLKSPIIPLIIMGILLFVSLLYYKTPLFRGEPEEEPVATATPEPTQTPVVSDKPEITTVTVEEVESVLKPAATLITSKYYYKNAADFKSVLTFFDTGIELPFTTSKGYIIYNGVVSVGINFDELTFDIDNRKHSITVHLPKEKIQAHEIDNSSVQTDTQQSILNMLNAEYYSTLIAGFKKQTENEILNNTDYMKQVHSNTENVIRSFLLASDVTGKYKVVFE